MVRTWRKQGVYSSDSTPTLSIVKHLYGRRSAESELWITYSQRTPNGRQIYRSELCAESTTTTTEKRGSQYEICNGKRPQEQRSQMDYLQRERKDDPF